MAKNFFIKLAVAALLSLAIGVLLSAAGIGGSWAQNIVVSLCIGLLTSLFIQVRLRLRPDVTNAHTVYILAVPVGVAAGVGLMLLMAKPGSFDQAQRIALTVLATGLTFGAGVTTMFYLYARKAQVENELHEVELRRSEAETRGIESQLRMLQAQIEPHFLFNTLANVVALIERDPPLARRLLEQLIVYLRATLARTRSQNATLADEIGLLRAYLDICRVRMGERLRYRFDIPEDFLRRPFPPMLLQPLVENAVKHGLEPKATAGEILVRATHRDDAGMCISVVDNGIGFSDMPGGGAGMANVRARLAALYGGTAQLVAEENPDGGVKVSMDIPA